MRRGALTPADDINNNHHDIPLKEKTDVRNNDCGVMHDCR